MHRGIARLVLGTAFALLAGKQVAANPGACCFSAMMSVLNACKSVGCKGACNGGCSYNPNDGSCVAWGDCCSCTSW